MVAYGDKESKRGNLSRSAGGRIGEQKVTGASRMLKKNTKRIRDNEISRNRYEIG